MRVHLKGVCVRFILGNGEQLKEKLQVFPLPWVSWLQTAKILVIGVIDDRIVAAYGIRGLLNMVTAYVEKEYRGQGIGGQLFERGIDAARKQGLHFLTGEALSDNKTSLHLCFKSGCRVVKRLPTHESVLILWPLTIKGEFVHMFLRIVCSVVPSDFLAQITEWFSKKTTFG